MSLGCLPPIAQQQCQVANLWPSPPLSGTVGSQANLLQEILGTALGETSVLYVDYGIDTHSCRD
jgi:hypothetical protein